ncbi:hypothetical protein [Olivibacter sp. XZL3]|uniref:hypothetical protein n=1 Tax=Olivibacter sp. XZL3 TaxID=1735116 RepID=UPI001065AAEC|nr:hypothetical protein [Olivibacter sp. XZL3]
MTTYQLRTCFLTLIFGWFFLSCDKEEHMESSLYGKWQLKESLSDIGNGSGKWEKTKDYQYIVLSENGDIETNIGSMVSYSIVDSVHLEIAASDREEKLLYRYYLEGNQLTLNPPCFEACGMRFVKTE